MQTKVYVDSNKFSRESACTKSNKFACPIRSDCRLILQSFLFYKWHSCHSNLQAHLYRQAHGFFNIWVRQAFIYPLWPSCSSQSNPSTSEESIYGHKNMTYVFSRISYSQTYFISAWSLTRPWRCWFFQRYGQRHKCYQYGYRPICNLCSNWYCNYCNI